MRRWVHYLARWCSAPSGRSPVRWWATPPDRRSLIPGDDRTVHVMRADRRGRRRAPMQAMARQPPETRSRHQRCRLRRNHRRQRWQRRRRCRASNEGAREGPVLIESEPDFTSVARFYSLKRPKNSRAGLQDVGGGSFPASVRAELEAGACDPTNVDIHTLLGTSNHVLTATAADAALPLLQCVQKPGAHR